MTVDITKNISQLVASQFPSLYREEGENIVAFVQAYYEFLETDPKYSIQRNRSIFETSDIDETLDEFLIHFKKKYLADFPFLSSTDTRFLVKHILDHYRAKGSEQSLKLLMRLIFDQDVELYYPSRDIFKLSDSKWTEKRYVEVTPSLKNASFLGKRVYSDRFNASGVVENIITKRVNGKIFDVIYLSDIVGSFSTGDVLTTDGDTADSPTVIGSLTTVDISFGGANYKVGDLLDVWSDNGKDGIVKVQSIFSQTDTVSFSIVDGGFGYTLDGNTVIYVANSIIFIDNTSTPFSHMDPVVQIIEQVYTPNTANVSVGDTAVSSSNSSIYGTVVNVANTYFKVNTRVGSFAGSSDVIVSGNTLPISNVTSNNITGKLIAQLDDRVGVWRDSTNSIQFYHNANTYITIDGTEKEINSVALGSGAIFEIGTLSDTQTANVSLTPVEPYLSVALNAVDYGIEGGPNDSNTVISQALAYDDVTIGTITSLTNVNPGALYNASTFIYVETPIIKSHGYRDYTINITAPITGSFVVGNVINQGNTVFGRVKSVVGNTLSIRNLSFGETFTANSTPISGINGSALISTVALDYAANTMATNAYIAAAVFGDPGTISALKVVSSGIGYTDGESVMMTHRATSNTNPIAILGTANLGTSGKQLGYWETRTSHINEVDIRIRDNKYYQEYSYDVIASQSLDKYEKLIRSVLHVAGTELFGSVSIASNVDTSFTADSEITKTELTTSYLLLNGANLISNTSYVTVQTEVEV